MRYREIAGPHIGGRREKSRDFDLIITVVLTADEFAAAQVPLLESIWRPSVSPGLLVRVDPARPEISQQRHVHIAREKHKSAKGMQTSWNSDGSRHDKKTFNRKLGGQEAYRAAARAALDLPPEITLEWRNPRSNLVLLCEAVLRGEPRRVILASAGIGP